MDDSQQARDGCHLPVQGPHLPATQDTFLAPPTALKLVLEPSGMTVELRRPDMVLGRHSSADVRLPLPDVSRRHCRFAYQSNDWQVVDLQSLNGVYVNGERVEQAVLHDGDSLGIGGFHFKVEIIQAPQASAGSASDSVEKNGVIQNIANTLSSRPLDSAQRKAS